jgi:hypothetical protein
VASVLPDSIATISDRRIDFRGSSAEESDFSILPAVRVIIMLPSCDFSLHEVRKRPPKPVAIRKE